VSAAAANDWGDAERSGGWAFCFAVVAAAHGLAQWRSLNNSSKASDSASRCRCELELPESLVTSEGAGPGFASGTNRGAGD